MKHLKLFSLAILIFGLGACQPQNEPEKPVVCPIETDTFTLDLTALSETFTFNEKGLWNGTYQGEANPFTIGEFTFSHYGHTDNPTDETDWTSWEGFTLAKTGETKYEDYLTDEFNCVAGHGIKGANSPYLMAYISGYQVQNDILFAQESKPLEVSFCQSAWTNQCITQGELFARAFTQGDYLTINIDALDAEGKVIEGKRVMYYLADYRSADAKAWTINKGWERCDLSALGTAAGLRFTMTTTDMGEWGANTALYFALDGLKIAHSK